MTEPPRHQLQDAFALAPAIVASGLIVVGVAAGFVNVAIDNEDASKVIATVAVGSWLLGLAAGLYALGAASSQIAMLRAEERTIALPATALALALVVCIVASTPIALLGLMVAFAHDHPPHTPNPTLRVLRAAGPAVGFDEPACPVRQRPLLGLHHGHGHLRQRSHG